MYSEATASDVFESNPKLQGFCCEDAIGLSAKELKSHKEEIHQLKVTCSYPNGSSNFFS